MLANGPHLAAGEELVIPAASLYTNTNRTFSSVPVGDLLDILRPTGGPFWLALGFVLAIFELLDGSFVLLSLGLGVLLTSVFAFLGVDSLAVLVGLCAVCQLTVFALVRPMVLRLMHKESRATNVDALSGKRGVVVRAIGSSLEAGYVKVEGEEWRATSANDQPLKEGGRVVVQGVSGATLSVLLDELENQEHGKISGRLTVTKGEE